MDDRFAAQAEGKHPAPCARFCEATAFEIEIRRLRADADRYRWLRQNFAALDFSRGDNRLHIENGDAPEKLDVLIDELRGE